MPTSRPRHVITESDDIARALDDAARHWPAEHGNRRRLLLRLVQEGYRAVRATEAADLTRHLDAVARTSGALTGAYETGYLNNLRADWPE